MKNYFYLLLCIFSVTLELCDREEYVPIPEEPIKGERHTVIMYAVAENSLSPYFRYDFEELAKAKLDVPSDCNFILYVDDCTSPRLYSLSKKGMKQIKSYPEQNSCDANTFKHTLQDIIEEYPSKNYSLVMWSHGSGAVPPVNSIFGTRTIGIDNNENSEYDICETASELEIPSLAQSLEEIGISWNYIIFDACFMQSIEVAYELKDVAKYIIGTPAEMPGKGLPYDHVLQYLFLEGSTVAKNICNVVEDYYLQLNSGKYGVVMSSIETSKLESLATATKKVIERIDKNISVFDYTGVQSYCVFLPETAYKPEYFDIGSLIYHITDEQLVYEKWNKTMSAALLAKKAASCWVTSYPNFDAELIDRTHVSSVSMFVPNFKYEKHGYNEYQKHFKWYRDAGINQLKYK